ncbi:[Citrate [pro-3S]-lyase] ligase [bioreactor metagenome]|uniref:[Citrate [pro-3S]-lyase] ligase n=1 Tax=bioreactor metagenome TaxID=1076179 RepID=A0A644T961_9ZZZZ|nr:[citrate (pro-3S)-lyase] ligase [Negativicutes bacterium]
MYWGDFEERVINLKNNRQVAEVRQFLSNFALIFDENAVEYTMAIYRSGVVIATGSLSGEVLRNIAVDESLQGEGLTAAVISHLLKVASRKGIYHYFVFTKPEKAHLFAALGFREISRAEPYAALLESGLGSIENYCREISNHADLLPPGQRACLVVNCNPFTLGHQAVIAKAAEENQGVVVLVVSEDQSVFPFHIRFRLVKQGLSHYKNIVVIPAGKYIVSAATFPGYFTSGEETILAETRLDAEIFAQYIAPALQITARYVGNEPYCPVTRAYNQAMKDILPQRGINVIEMPRLEINGEIISASKVRQAIRDNDWQTVQKMVPEVTYDYLLSEEGVPIVDKIRQTLARH